MMRKATALAAAASLLCQPLDACAQLGARAELHRIAEALRAHIGEPKGRAAHTAAGTAARALPEAHWVFDGGAARALAEVEAPGSSSSPSPVNAQSRAVLLDRGASVPAPAKPGRTPDNLKGKIARVAGAAGSAAALGTAGFFLWGPAAAAFYAAGAALKSAQYNSDLQKPGSLRARFLDALGGHADLLRFVGGIGLWFGGMFTGNPMASYFGITFIALSAGDVIGKELYSGAYDLLGAKTAASIGRHFDGLFQDPGAKHRRLEALYQHRGQIVRCALAAAISMGAMVGVAGATESVMNNAQGVMAPADGRLTVADKIRNTAIGAYRMYNLPEAAYQDGPHTRAFYAEMKARYNPKSPEDWANIVENQTTWTSHADLYGTNMYYVSSEEAATVRTFNGVPGYYTDCTGKGALLQNMLRMDGYGSSHVVVGVPPLGGGNEGHIWIINPNASGPRHELFHYDNTQNLLYSQVLDPAHGVQGDRMAAFAAGGTGGVITDLAYRGLERWDRHEK